MTFLARDNSGINCLPNQPFVCVIYQTGIKYLGVCGAWSVLPENFGRQMVLVEIIMAKNGVYAAIQEAENSKRRADKNVIAEGMSGGGSKAIPWIRTQHGYGATTVWCNSSRPGAACIKREFKDYKCHMASSPLRMNHRGVMKTCPLHRYRQSSPDHLDACVLVLENVNVQKWAWKNEWVKSVLKITFPFYVVSHWVLLAWSQRTCWR